MGTRLLVEEMTFALPAGGIVGVIGPNGAGKTTLFRMITGQETPDSAGQFVSVTRFNLLMWIRVVNSISEKSIWQEISGGNDQLQLGESTGQFEGLCRRAFQLSAAAINRRKLPQYQVASATACIMAKMLKEGANVLLLDEPTNDLDVNTMRALEDGLENFAGCVVVISHDRWFLDRIATHILAFEGDSRVTWFEGNYSEYEADRKERLGAEADRPHRIKYRHLTR